MKTKLKVLALTVMLSTTAAMAGESLVAIEGNYGVINVDQENSSTGLASNDNVNLAGLGVKIGAQSDEFRVFLNATYYGASDDDYDYVATYGAEIDYLIKPSPKYDIYLGFNAGMANIEQIDSLGVKRTSSDPYLGGSVGVNIHTTKTIDLELGGRMLFLDISNSRNNIKYTYNTIASAYASVIFKFTMD